MSTDLAILVCSICQGSRWVCAEHPLAPWHLGHQHCESHGTPCTTCNPGPEFKPWNTRCLDCASPAEFTAACADDEDVIFAAMLAGLPDPDVPDGPT